MMIAVFAPSRTMASHEVVGIWHWCGRGITCGVDEEVDVRSNGDDPPK
jgi:hypothetical protein